MLELMNENFGFWESLAKIQERGLHHANPVIAIKLPGKQLFVNNSGHLEFLFNAAIWIAQGCFVFLN